MATSLLFPFAPSLPIEHRLVGFFAFRPEGFVPLRPFLADRLDVLDRLLGQSVIPTPESVLVAGMRFLTVTFPKPLLHSPAPDNAHEM